MIFGIGFGRTGTRSLALALRGFGYRVAHWAELYRNLRMDLTLNPEVFVAYDALIDCTMPLMYRELWAPEHKFILTIRNVNDWYQSVIRHRRSCSTTALKRKLRKEIFGVEDLHEPSLKYAFLRHEINVKNFFRDKDNLLILDVDSKDKWGLLCPFLGKERPDITYPHKNKTKKEKK